MAVPAEVAAIPHNDPSPISSRSSSRSASPAPALEAHGVPEEETLAERAARLQKWAAQAEWVWDAAIASEDAARARFLRDLHGDGRGCAEESKRRLHDAERAYDAARAEWERAEHESCAADAELREAEIDAWSRQEDERLEREAAEEKREWEREEAQRVAEGHRAWWDKRNYYVRLKYGATSNECPW